VSYFAKEIFRYYLEYARGKGVPRKMARGTEGALQHAFERADPTEQIEYVFDRVLVKVWNPVKTINLEKEGKLPPQVQLDPNSPVDAYEALCLAQGWEPLEKVRALEVIQATEIKPSEGFIEWLEGAIARYFVEFARSQANGVPDYENSFYDKFLTGDEIGQCGSPVENKRSLNEPVEICRAHVPIQACSQFTEVAYVPSTRLDTDLHMHTSFTNRLRGVDWNYYLQAD
jgi:hypothetical protein